MNHSADIVFSLVSFVVGAAMLRTGWALLPWAEGEAVVKVSAVVIIASLFLFAVACLVDY